MSGPDPARSDRPPAGASVTVYPDGPLIVQGDFELRGADGAVVSTERTTLALCRCGRSRLKPLCDGSHRVSRFADPADPAEMTAVLATARPPGPGRRNP